MTKALKKDILQNCKALGLDPNADTFTLKELDAIAKKSHCDRFAVMGVLRGIY